jgi:hypothetical protein
MSWKGKMAEAYSMGLESGKLDQLTGQGWSLSFRISNLPDGSFPGCFKQGYFHAFGRKYP